MEEGIGEFPGRKFNKRDLVSQTGNKQDLVVGITLMDGWKWTAHPVESPDLAGSIKVKCQLK